MGTHSQDFEEHNRVVARTTKHVAGMRDVAVDPQQAHKEYSKKRHDVKARHRYFEKGDNVLVFSPVISGEKMTSLVTDGKALTRCWGRYLQ